MDGDRKYGEGFDLRRARLPDFYPTDDVLAEMGRVAIAATRVDSQLALLLLAVKYPEPENPESLDVLLKWPASRLAEQAQSVLKRRFEGHLLDVALAAVNCAAERQDQRHVACTACGRLNRPTRCSRWASSRDWRLRTSSTNWCRRADEQRNTRRFIPEGAVPARRR
jgi:hypothetical protein